MRTIIFSLLLSSFLYAGPGTAVDQLRSSDLKVNWEALNRLTIHWDATATPLLYPFLTHENARVAALACRALAGHGGKEGEDRIVALLSGEKSDVKPNALAALIAYHDPGLQPIFEESKSGSNAILQLIAGVGIMDLGAANDPAPVEKALDSDTMEITIWALRALAYSRLHDIFERKAILLLDNSHDEIRGAAAEALGYFRTPAVSHALSARAVKETYHYVRIACIDALIRLYPLSKEDLISLLENPRTAKWTVQRLDYLDLREEFVRIAEEKMKREKRLTQRTVKLAGILNDASVVPLLVKRLCRGKVETKAAPAILHLLIEQKDDRLTKRCIKRLFSRSDGKTLSYTCWYVGVFKKSGWDDTIRTLMGSDDPETLSGAVWAVGEMGLKDQKARVEELTHHKDSQVRYYAKEALKALSKKQ